MRTLTKLKLPTERPLEVSEVRIAGKLVPGMRFVIDVGEDLVITQESGPEWPMETQLKWVEP